MTASGTGTSPPTACTSPSAGRTLLGYERHGRRADGGLVRARPPRRPRPTAPRDRRQRRRREPLLRERAPDPPRRRHVAVGAVPRPGHVRRRRHAGPHHRLAVGHHRAAQRRGAPHSRRAARQPDRPAQPHPADGSHHPAACAAANGIQRAAAPCSTSTSTASSSSTTASATPRGTGSSSSWRGASERALRPGDTLARLGGDEFADRAGEHLLDSAGARDRYAPVSDHRRGGPIRAPRPADRAAASASPTTSTGSSRPRCCCAMPTSPCTTPRAAAAAAARCSTHSMHQRIVDRMSLGDPPAPGDRAAPAAHVLPADRRPQHRRHPRPRGAGSLARRRARRPAGRVHPRGRGVRADRPARLPGPARRLPHSQRAGAGRGWSHPRSPSASTSRYASSATASSSITFAPRWPTPASAREPRPRDHREHPDREPASSSARCCRSCSTSASRSQLDDFGTGYSSLTVLHDFPGDTLKIDRALRATTMIDRARARRPSCARSSAWRTTSGCSVIAEGIEDTDAASTRSTALGCEYGQGYHFAARCRPATSPRCWRRRPRGSRRPRGPEPPLRRGRPRGTAARRAAPPWAPRPACSRRSRRLPTRARCRWRSIGSDRRSR